MANQKQQKKAQEKLDAKVELPKGVSATVANGTITIKGPKGEVSREIDTKKVSASADGSAVSLQSAKATQKDKMFLGSLEAHVKNMVRGVQQPYVYQLKVCSGHFPITVAVSGDKLTIKNFFGEKVARVVPIKKGAAVKVDGDRITVESASKEVAGQVSADIEQITRRPNFDTRIFQDGIYIISKDGKEIK